MDKSELYKYLFLTEKDIPNHIMEVLWEYGMDLIYDLDPDLKNEFNKLLSKRQLDIFPNEGLRNIRMFFDGFDDNIQKVLKHISVSKQIYDLNHIKRILNSCKQTMPNEIIELELARHRPYIDDYIKRIDDELKQIQKTPNPQTKTTYEWQNNPDEELPELYRLMTNQYKLIAPEATYEQFKAIFTGQPTDQIEPVRWHQDNASELLYFIDRLEKSDNIKHNSIKADYKKMTACFVKPDGQAFNAVWKSLKTNLTINLSQDKQDDIDELVNNF